MFKGRFARHQHSPCRPNWYSLSISILHVVRIGTPEAPPRRGLTSKTFCFRRVRMGQKWDKTRTKLYVITSPRAIISCAPRGIALFKYHLIAGGLDTGPVPFGRLTGDRYRRPEQKGLMAPATKEPMSKRDRITPKGLLECFHKPLTNTAASFGVNVM